MSQKLEQAPPSEGISRREILGRGVAMSTLAATGIGAAVVGGAAGVMVAPKSAVAAEPDEASVPPGKLDEYIGFWSSGQTGEVRCGSCCAFPCSTAAAQPA